MANEAEVAVHLRTSPDEQRHHADNGFLRSPSYPFLAEKDDDEVALGFRVYGEELGLPDRLPVPPHSLPGFWQAKPDEQAMRLIRLGAKYALAMARGEKRTLWLVHEEIRTALEREYKRGAAETEARWQARMLEEARAAERSRQADDALVYFIQATTGEIKIGIAQDVEKRLKALQTSHHGRLTLLASCPGGQPLEREYHQRFAEHRLAGEWFTPVPAILEEVARISPTPAAGKVKR